MLKRVHHINLIVRDLDEAMTRYSEGLGVRDWYFGELDSRGVRTARFRAGDSWIVLVQPTHLEGAPGRYLEQHGEGLFLLSFEVDSLDQALAEMDSKLKSGEPRQGLDNWRVADLSMDSFFGAQLQLVEEEPGG